MQTRKKLLIVCSFALLTGCQTMIFGSSSDLEKISVGMRKADVVATLGSPVSVGADADKGEETLVYKRMKHVISESPMAYVITLRDGKVVRYGEQYPGLNVNR